MGAGFTVAVEIPIPPAAVGVLPLDIPVSTKLEKQGSHCALSGERAVAPDARDGVAAVGGLDDGLGVLHAGLGTGAVEAGEAVLPGEVPARVELGGQHAGGRTARDRGVVVPGGHVAAVRCLLHRVEIGLRRSGRAEVSLPLHVSLAVKLEDQRAGVLIRVGRGAGSYVAAVAGLLDLVDAAPIGPREVHM